MLALVSPEGFVLQLLLLLGLAPHAVFDVFLLLLLFHVEVGLALVHDHFATATLALFACLVSDGLLIFSFEAGRGQSYASSGCHDIAFEESATKGSSQHWFIHRRESITFS